MRVVNLLLVVVVQLPDGPRHDDGERYTWRDWGGGGIEFFSPPLSLRSGKYLCEDFMLQISNPSLSSLHVSHRGARRLPSSVKCNRCCWALIHTRRPGLVTVWLGERPELRTMGSRWYASVVWVTDFKWERQAAHRAVPPEPSQPRHNKTSRISGYFPLH